MDCLVAFKNTSTALTLVQKIKNIFAINIKVIILSKILFFSQVLQVLDFLNTDCAACCYHIVSVSTNAHVAVLQDWIGDANRPVALGPPSGWRLKKLPGASQGFCHLLYLSYLDDPSFLPLLSMFLLCLCAAVNQFPSHSRLHYLKSWECV